ncbi:type II toxin-antitoxin system RelB/DinJ family antitoxin [Patescibacteria group bacterium]|nr:type II toxin-antitoxin system RelB/DinJ family antitoxin [Patescibacteria group bacterium]
MKTVINVKADKETKEKAKKIAQELGLSLSAVVNAYLKQFVKNKSIYFSANKSYRMTPELENMIGKIEKDIKKKKNLSNSIVGTSELKKFISSL